MSILTTPIASLKSARFTLDALGSDPTGRIEWWEQPDPNLTYVVGADTAYGIEGRDYDAACVLVKGDGNPRQVAEAHGHWGERFDRILFALHRVYNDAFLCVERASTGLPVMRRLYDEYGMRWMYYQRTPSTASLAVTDKLGYNPTHNDLVVADLVRAVRADEITLRSTTLMDQMSRLQWSAPNEVRDIEDRVGDSKLRMKLPGGGSPDLVMACAFALHAWREVVHYDHPKTNYGPGTYGEVLGHNDLLKKPPSAASWGVRR